MSSAAHSLSEEAKGTSDFHRISLYVKNEPGVLARVAMVFSRRGYNIESLVVSAAAKSGYSRMTITSSGDRAILEQMIKQLAKLIDVVHAIDHTGDAAYETEIALIKLQSSSEERHEILQIVEHFGAKVVDFTRDSLVIRVYGSSEKLDAIRDLLAKFNISELVRSGKILMARGRAMT
jgi:acetolactate synthase-1/3 small subunit